MRSIACTLVTVAALASVAHAGKPTAAEAKKTVQAWLAAMDVQGPGDSENPTLADPASTEAVALTAPAFHAAFYNEPYPGWASAVATDAKAIAAALQCLRTHMLAEGKLKAWSKKMAREEGLAYIHKQDLRELAKTATLVKLDNPCPGGNEAIFAVSKNADGKPVVTAAFAQLYMCGE